MILKELRQRFERDLVKIGRPSEDIFAAEVSEDMISRWQNRFDSCPVEPITPGKRLRNAFLLGSDPEFVMTSDGTHKRNAYEQGLKVGLALGCDQNERLVELRPCPADSAIKHVAGILCVLRWLYRSYPNTQGFSWICPPFFDGDGIGGHVHFGRKRPTRDLEIQALDRLALVLLRAGIFNGVAWYRRMRGDSRNQLYGRFSDIRTQSHGYEYRSFPSWLDSPTKAFVVLATSKLVVCDPDLVMGWLDTLQDPPLEKLIRFARYHRSLDDDAWVLYNLLVRFRTAPRWLDSSTSDFKLRWGLQGEARAPVHIFPSCIKPATEDILDTEAFLLNDVLLPMRNLAPSFSYNIPDGYYWLPTHVATERRAGVGDFIHDLVMAEKESVVLNFSSSDPGVSARLWTCITREEREILRTLRLSVLSRPGLEIRLASNWLRVGDNASVLRKILLGSSLPVWTVETVDKLSYKKWKMALDKTVEEGRIL